MKHNLLKGAAIILTTVGLAISSSASLFIFNQPRTPKALQK